MKFRTRITRANPIAWPPDRNLPSNPNKGATRTKIIGLPADWTQTIRIERWHYPARIQPAYFLICPGCATLHEPSSRRRGSTHPQHSHLDQNPCSSVSIRGSNLPPPPLSTRPPGRLDPSKSGGACPQRCLKLMMIQCTRAEALDAHAAELWLASLPPSLRQREPYMTFAHRLIARYGPIMSPRRLLCPRCVGGPGAGVSYGNNPETVRQGWRRRNRRPDTTITANPHALLVPLNHFTHYNYDLAQMNINATRRPRKAEA